VRERLFKPRLRVTSFDELNIWLVEQCIKYARAHRHPEVRDRTIWEQFEAERPSLVPYAGKFDGFHAVPASVSKTVDVYVDRSVRQQPLLGIGACDRAAGGNPRLC
jgi:hypothetical protein